MPAMQGEGKIRLIAKNSLLRDSAAIQRYRTLRTTGNLPAMPGGSSVPPPLASEAVNFYVEFHVTPEVTETGSVTYAEISDIRAASSVLWYQGSPSRNFSINAKLVSRTLEETQYNSYIIHTLKSWRMPETIEGDSGIGGGTPSVLYLQGYGKMFKDIPVVMTDLSIELSSEYDFLKTADNEILPIVTSISISLKEAHSLEGNVDDFEKFDIIKYRNANLGGW